MARIKRSNGEYHLVLESVEEVEHMARARRFASERDGQQVIIYGDYSSAEKARDRLHRKHAEAQLLEAFTQLSLERGS